MTYILRYTGADPEKIKNRGLLALLKLDIDNRSLTAFSVLFSLANILETINYLKLRKISMGFFCYCYQEGLVDFITKFPLFYSTFSVSFSQVG